MHTKRIIFLILTITWMAVIFCFSHRPGPESSQDSYEVGMLVCNIFVPDFQELSPETQMEYALAIDHPVRKFAHFSEYLLLAVLLVGALVNGSNGVVTSFKMYLLPWFITVLYAMSDEFHQLFVVGRDGNLLDVIIDSAGGLMGVFICFMVGRIKSRRDK